MRVDVLGIPFDNLSPAEAVERALSLLEEGKPHRVVTPNPEVALACRQNPAAMEAVCSADLILPDGIGIVRAARILGRPLQERVTGYDFAMALLRRISGMGRSVFLLGAQPGVAEEAAGRLCAQMPDLRVAGTQHGYFSEEAAVLEKIRESGADVLFVCLGAPRQEIWMRENAHRLPCRLLVGLGGSLDGMAGRVVRAPVAWQRLGLEWLYRMLREPVRFKRFGALPRFMRAVFRQKREEKGHAART